MFTPHAPAAAAGAVVLLAAMPTGANAYIFAVQYPRPVNPVSGRLRWGRAATLPVVVVIVTGVR
ncbi:hypothetical protein JQ596_16150 [Bradyrhizobium manausense]|uniref:hypothetical protein n=1 Tax=Bradyrhizobium manausense TaxID=989370 RepID=UPI001BAE1324|nr:hypothetical protein [Bradyrhizobium manausense]MBR0827073.1 hypothetical protein [Bradyrhizobium manausense]